MSSPIDFFGVAFDPLAAPSAVLGQVELTEKLGYGSVWIADSQVLWREAYVLMAAAAIRTSRISIGSGVTNPVTRDPTVIASAFATLDELAPGRIELGIGSGDSALRTIGKRAPAIAEFERVLFELSRMLLGVCTDADPEGIRLSFPRRVPVLLSATGPRGLRLAARIADGVILHFLTPDPSAVAQAKATIRSEAERVGRDLTDFRFIGWVPCNIDDSPERARAGVRVHVARHLLMATATPTDVDHGLIDRLRVGYDYSEHMHPEARHADLVPAEMVERFALVGSPTAVADQLTRMLEAGFDHLVIVPRGDFDSVVQRFAEDVVPRL